MRVVLIKNANLRKESKIEPIDPWSIVCSWVESRESSKCSEMWEYRILEAVVGRGRASRGRNEVALSSLKLRKFERTHRKNSLIKNWIFCFPLKFETRRIETRQSCLPLGNSQSQAAIARDSNISECIIALRGAAGESRLYCMKIEMFRSLLGDL